MIGAGEGAEGGAGQDSGGDAPAVSSESQGIIETPAAAEAGNVGPVLDERGDGPLP